MVTVSFADRGWTTAFPVEATALADRGSISVQTEMEERATSSSQTPYRSLPVKAESSLIPLLVLSPADPLRWALPGPRSGLWKPWGARVGSYLSLERSFGDLLPASVSALQASPKTSDCGSSYVPTAQGCSVRSYRVADTTEAATDMIVTALVHPQSALRR
jgi:hypothetical protein